MLETPLISTLSLDLARLSFLVGTLGSKHHAGWWNCSFLSPEGLETLAYNFPRTTVSAAVTATAKAAANQHDQAVGAVGVFHLFRLPPALAERVHRAWLSTGGELHGHLGNRDACLAALREISDEETADFGSGARNLGGFREDDGALVNRLAASYAKAFSEGYQTFPYFTLSPPQ